MRFRRPLGLCAMIVACVAIGSLFERVPTHSPAWSYASAAMTYAAGAFAGGVIARRGFVLAASLLALAVGAGLVAILVSIGGELLATLRHPLLLTSVACTLCAAIAGAWSGQRFAAWRETRALAT